MSFKSIVRELKEMRDRFSSSSRRGNDGGGALWCPWPNMRHCHQEEEEEEEDWEQGRWANLPPELLLDVMQRVEVSEVAWPARRNVVSCSSVCRSWREITNEVVQTLEQCGRITFPISLKQVVFHLFVVKFV